MRKASGKRTENKQGKKRKRNPEESKTVHGVEENIKQSINILRNVSKGLVSKK